MFTGIVKKEKSLTKYRSVLLFQHGVMQIRAPKVQLSRDLDFINVKF
jgi:hypothetical protein